MDKYTLGSLAQLFELELVGSPESTVTGLATLSSAEPGQLSFFSNNRYQSALKQTKASAVILHYRDASKFSGHKLLCDNPYLVYAKVSQLFSINADSKKEEKDNNLIQTSKDAEIKCKIHATAIIDSTVLLADSVVVGANTIIEAGVILADGVIIDANCTIAQGTKIAANSHLYPNVTIYPQVKIGKNVIIHAGVVIGSDGFGFVSDGEKYHKIAQLGGVQIGDDVEIGAGTCIDCGALDDTIIEKGVKIDNQVQIAHNVRIGAHTIICGCSAIAGSSTIGKNCIIAGGVGIINNLTIVDDVTITAMSLVNQSIKVKGLYSSGTGLTESKLWKKNIVRFRQLDEFNKRLENLEKNNN